MLQKTNICTAKPAERKRCLSKERSNYRSNFSGAKDQKNARRILTTRKTAKRKEK